MVKKLQFLCGNDGKKLFVYGVRCPMGPFYYFDKLDSILSAHVTLPAELGSIVTSRKKVIEVELNEEQLKNYWKNEKFVFKNKALKTCKIRNIRRHNTKSIDITPVLKLIYRCKFGH